MQVAVGSLDPWVQVRCQRDEKQGDVQLVESAAPFHGTEADRVPGCDRRVRVGFGQRERPTQLRATDRNRSALIEEMAGLFVGDVQSAERVGRVGIGPLAEFDGETHGGSQHVQPGEQVGERRVHRRRQGSSGLLVEAAPRRSNRRIMRGGS